MGYDRQVLPPDRDQPEAGISWKRVIVTILVVGLFVAISFYAYSGR